MAILRPLGIEPELVPCALSAEVFERLADQTPPGEGGVDAAVIPIENSLAGPVSEHYDLLLQHDVLIERELRLRIRHNLIGPPGLALEEVRQVSSHPIALAQCRSFLATHSHMKVVPYYDTAGSVKLSVADPAAKLAGIASAQAAAEYGGEILASGIEDDAENYTRFHLVRRRGGQTTSDGIPDKMSLAFAVHHRPGTLVKALEALASCGVDLTKIDSRPVPGRPWEYVFFVDIRFRSKEMADAALAALKDHCLMVKDLGRYRAA